MNLGAHMSIAGGVDLALERGLSIGCNAVQLFVKNTNQWRARKLDPSEIERFHKLAGRIVPSFIMAHASYLVNLSSPDPKMLARSRKGFLEEMKSCETLGIPYIIIHPGSHKGAGEDIGIRTCSDSLNLLLEQTNGYNLEILLENTAGQGNTIGWSFEQLASIIDGVEMKERIGVCFDTCHAFAAGYDLRAPKKHAHIFDLFDGTIGLEKLKAFHLNDCMKDLGSRRDRHTHIGQGKLGKRAFSLLVNDSRFFDRPMILETPKGPDLEEDIENLALLRSLRKKTGSRGKRQS